ncbi:MAG: nucleotidyltransferase domain-containing protein [Alphaproteobacteria bacterium]|nr:nucleotidyltransferase domain-containing protein [Alphaproteobacteria bacterium]
MTIEDIKNAIKVVAADFPICRAVLFGSRANGTSTPESDVDLIMEFSAPVTLITISKIKHRLEDILMTDVDVIHGPIQDSDMIEIDKEIEVYAA